MKVKRSAMVQKTPLQMFSLVNDVARYPEFIPEIARVKILTQNERQIEAELCVRKGPFEQCFATCNDNLPPNRIDLRLKYGPLKRLQGHWLFDAIGEQGCRISFELDFEVNGLMGFALKPILTELADSMVKRFCVRAEQVYV